VAALARTISAPSQPASFATTIAKEHRPDRNNPRVRANLSLAIYSLSRENPQAALDGHARIAIKTKAY
jgi:hypothetical protein